MRGSTGVSTGGPDHPPRMEKHKAVDYLRITGWKSTKLPMSGHHPTASEAPLIAGRWLPVLVTLCVRASLLQ